MTLLLTRDPEEFAARTGDFLAERIECNVLATVLTCLLAGRATAGPPLFACLYAGGEVRCAALRAPPWFLLASEMDADRAGGLVARWLAEDPELPGVNGPPATARAVASAWAERTGGATRCRMREAMHVLTEVHDPPRPARGGLRLASKSERSLLVGWIRTSRARQA